MRSGRYFVEASRRCMEHEGKPSCRAVTLLPNQELDIARLDSGIDVVHAGEVDHQHQRRVLLNTAALAQIMELWLTSILRAFPIELGKCHQRDVEFSGHPLQPAGDRGHFVGPFFKSSDALRELDVIDDDEVELLPSGQASEAPYSAA